MRNTVSISIDEALLTRVKQTKGRRSTSERVNELLRRALEQERLENLEREATAFFASPQEDRAETRAFQAASRRTLTRES